MTKRILVFEFVTGGGFLSLAGTPPPEGSLLREGTAMVLAVARDLIRADLGDVCLMCDDRLVRSMTLPQCEIVRVRSAESLYRNLSQSADVAIAIAPEFDGHLQDVCRRLRVSSGCLLNCDDAFISWASQKSAVADRLLRLGIPCSSGFRLWPTKQTVPNEMGFPLVLKPDDGAGSQEVVFVANEEAWQELSPADGTRVETFIPGAAASVAALCGSGGVHWLPPCWQNVGSNDNFVYHGGAVIEQRPLVARALRLVGRLDPLLESARGSIGVDVVLGAATDGTEDFVIEINPRVTTSYLGLSSLCKTNLAEEMLRVASGESRRIEFENRPCTFRADGSVSHSTL